MPRVGTDAQHTIGRGLGRQPDKHGSIYVETRAFAREEGPEALRPVAEVAFADGVAQHSEGSCQVAAGIVGYADMTLGDRVAATLDAAAAASPRRFRGVRQIAIDHPDAAMLRFLTHPPPAGLLQSTAFRRAYRHLGQRGLSFDATVLHHQLPELARLAADFPDTTIVLSHAGLATATQASINGRKEVFDAWKGNLKELARRPNVFCKVGGLGTAYWGFGFNERTERVGFSELAATWRPYVETAIEAFGMDRCMMVSNYPNDGRSCGFVPLWNALKYIVRGCSAGEKRNLFCETAKRAYVLEREVG